MTIRRPAPRSLLDVRDPDGDPSYPVHVLRGCESALVLFSAAWHGRQDASHIADAGLTGTCVDVDETKLDEMKAVYPEGWRFVTADAFEFGLTTEERWDVVSLDPFSNLMDRCAMLSYVWCRLAQKAVILGTGTGTVVENPDGWQTTERRKRSDFGGGVYWTVLEKT